MCSGGQCAGAQKQKLIYQREHVIGGHNAFLVPDRLCRPETLAFSEYRVIRPELVNAARQGKIRLPFELSFPMHF